MAWAEGAKLNRKIRRGDIFQADLSGGNGDATLGVQPVLVIQNNVGNRVSDTVIVAAITSSQSSRSYPVNVKLPAGLLAGRSEARMNQVHTLGRNRIGSWIARLSFAEMAKVDEALRLSLGLPRGD